MIQYSEMEKNTFVNRYFKNKVKILSIKRKKGRMEGMEGGRGGGR